MQTLFHCLEVKQKHKNLPATVRLTGWRAEAVHPVVRHPSKEMNPPLVHKRIHNDPRIDGRCLELDIQMSYCHL